MCKQVSEMHAINIEILRTEFNKVVGSCGHVNFGSVLSHKFILQIFEIIEDKTLGKVAFTKCQITYAILD